MLCAVQDIRIIILVNEIPVFTCLEVLEQSGEKKKKRKRLCTVETSESNSVSESMQLLENQASGMSRE